MPVYNAEDYLAEACDCILNQTHEDIELICVDDGSTDTSLKILNDMTDLHCRTTGSGYFIRKTVEGELQETLHFKKSQENISTAWMPMTGLI